MKSANKIVTAVAGLVLIIASALKIEQLLTVPIISTGFWESWEFFLIQIPLELGLGIWLLCGLFKKAAWLAAVISFALFIAVTLQKALAGYESCGCFGRVDVNPWITLTAVDVSLFLGLLIFRPIGLKLLPPPWPSAKRFFGVAIPTFIILAVIELILAFNKPPDETSKYIVVRPENQTSSKQTSEEWPMLEHIDIADSLTSGIVVVLLYHLDCPGCKEAIELYDRTSRELAGSEDAIRFAFIEIPPYTSEQNGLIPPDTPCLAGRLDTGREWYITSPFVVVLVDGSLVKSWQAEVPELDEILDEAAEMKM